MIQKVKALKHHLPKTQTLQVWDNLESASGVQASGSEGLLSSEDRQLLADLLQSLRGGKSRVLITSRNTEDWLPQSSFYRLPLGGFSGEDRWSYCNAIVQSLNIEADRKDTHWKTLMDELQGHPVAMRIVLLQLQHHSAQQLLVNVQGALRNLSDKDPDTQRLFAALSVLDTLDRATYQSPLQLLGLHRRYVDADYLEAMLKEHEGEHDISGCMHTLQQAGLVHSAGQNIWQIHAALPVWVAQHQPASDELTRRFVDFMGSYAQHHTDVAIERQQFALHVHGGSMQAALALSESLAMDQPIGAIVQFYGDAALNQRQLGEAVRHITRLKDDAERLGNEHGAASTYHQLGIIAQQQRDYDTAAQWYHNSLAIFEKQGNEHGAANTKAQLGLMAKEKGDWLNAAESLLSAFTGFATSGDKRSATSVAGIYSDLYSSSDEEVQSLLKKKWMQHKAQSIFAFKHIESEGDNKNASKHSN